MTQCVQLAGEWRCVDVKTLGIQLTAGFILLLILLGGRNE